jgi:chromosome segregation ATPase
LEIKLHDRNFISLKDDHDRLLSKLSKLNLENEFHAKLTEDLNRLNIELQQKQKELSLSHDEIHAYKKEIDKVTSVLAQRNTIIQRLKDEIKKRDDELNNQDEENSIKVYISYVDERVAVIYQQFDDFKIKKASC